MQQSAMTFVQSVGYMIALIGVLFVSDIINQTVYDVRQSGRMAGSAEAATSNTSWLATALSSWGLGLFYVVLIAWALFVAYMVVRYRQERAIVGPSISEFTPRSVFAAVDTHEVQPDLFPAQYKTQTPQRANTTQRQAVSSAARTAPAPANLPTATVQTTRADAAPAANTPCWESELVPVADTESETVPVDADAARIAELEHVAHQRRILTSADAIAYLLQHKRAAAAPRETFMAVLDLAAATYPAEDGWIIVNVPRMQTLLL